MNTSAAAAAAGVVVSVSLLAPLCLSVYVYSQDHHFSGKPGNVREFCSRQGYVWKKIY